MALIDIKWAPTTRELRVFAVLWFVFFGLLGVWLQSRGYSQTSIASLWTVAFTGGILGLLFPALLRPVYLLWMGLAFPIGWLVSHLILGLVYFALLAPIGLLMRMTGHDPLGLRLGRVETSYWTERPTETKASRYFRQY
ncbi:MAG: hypothetical protein JKY86_04145 [Gammaproteobacteria bacterium]|nr:hypothetical protein [Gammaproteobacteria bacterium]